jgi:RNA polymerase sigma factor (sigma-70 family)
VSELLEQILDDIDHVVMAVTPNVEDQNELRQDLCIIIYEKQDKVRKVMKDNKLRGWLFSVARNWYLDQKKGRNKSNHRTVKTVRLRNTNRIPDEHIDHYKPDLKTLEDMLKELPEIDRLWITTYMECDFNCSEVERRIDVSRRHVKLRIDYILEKWKHLDIYLP